MKTLPHDSRDDGTLTSYIVTLRPFIGQIPGDASGGDTDYGPEESQQFWAEDIAHAGEQADDAEPFCAILRVETQSEFEERTGVMLDYGRTERY